MTIGEKVEQLEEELMDHYLYSDNWHNQFLKLVNKATCHIDITAEKDWYLKDLVNELQEEEAISLYNSLQTLVKVGI